jgi:hypothetical protein
MSHHSFLQGKTHAVSHSACAPTLFELDTAATLHLPNAGPASSRLAQQPLAPTAANTTHQQLSDAQHSCL